MSTMQPSINPYGLTPAQLARVEEDVRRYGDPWCAKGPTFHLASGTSFNVWLESASERDNLPLLHRLLDVLRALRFDVAQDAEHDRRWPALAGRQFVASRGGLSCVVALHGRHIELDFYPDPNPLCDNPNGPRYTFNKLEGMSYAVRLLHRLAVRHLSRLLLGEGLADRTKPLYADPLMWIAYEQRTSGHWKPGVGHPICMPGHNDVDRDGKQLVEGQFKHFRGSVCSEGGRLMRGRVFFGLNNVHRAVCGGTVFILHNGQFFDAGPDEPRRHFSRDEIAKRLGKLKRKAVEQEQFERAAILRDLLAGVQRTAEAA